MGALCGKSPMEKGVSFRDIEDGNVKVLIVALNYDYVPGAELTCHQDAHTMVRIADRANVYDITLNTDRRGIGGLNFPTRSVVLSHIALVGRRCKAGDWFVWFWAGHGVNVPDKKGDEATGFDQAFVTPDVRGKLTEKSVLVDDEFAHALETFVPEGVKILCICDCCHSGTICDIDSYRYTHEIYQISASQDNEEAEDIGGGVLTKAMKKAVRKLSLQYPYRDFTIQDVFNLSKKYANRLTKEQELSFQWSGTDPDLVTWPLGCGWTEYAKDPLRQKVDIFDFEVAEDIMTAKTTSEIDHEASHRELSRACDK